MRRKSFRTTLCGALVLVAVSCSFGSEVPPVTTATSTTAVPLTSEQAAIEFHSCLLEQGLTVPDLPLDDEGRPDLSALADAVDQGSSEWRAALTACAGLIAANGALDLSANPELAEAVRAQLVAFSTCMRSQGVDAFPDPPADFNGTTTPFPLSEIPVADPDLGPAAEMCALAVGERPPG
jgi:hypothetical protein